MSDLISREALKKAIEEAFTNYELTIGINTYYDVINIINNVPTVDINTKLSVVYLKGRRQGQSEERPQGKWIPVSERLPDKNMPCLVSVGKFNFTQIAMYSDLMETIDHKIFYQGDYGKNNFQNITEYVNAWQPFPEPYKKGEEE